MNDALITTLRGLLAVINQAAVTAIETIDAHRHAASPELQEALSKIRGGSELPPMLGRDNAPESPSDQE